jgi:hypothetical protein
VFDAKLLADFITSMRCFLGFVLAWLGLSCRKDALSLATIILLLDWTGDFFDGRIARLTSKPRTTWIGNHDLQVDLFFSLGLGIYLVGSGYVTNIVAICYLVFWGLVLWRWGFDRNLLMLVQAPIYLANIFIVLLEQASLGIWLVAWVLGMLTINWKKFSSEIVPHFIQGIQTLWSSKH